MAIGPSGLSAADLAMRLRSDLEILLDNPFVWNI
jgi:hypothetical protein